MKHEAQSSLAPAPGSVPSLPLREVLEKIRDRARRANTERVIGYAIIYECGDGLIWMRWGKQSPNKQAEPRPGEQPKL